MVVTGNVAVKGGASFEIAEGSSLTLLTTGEVDFPSGIVLGDGKPTRMVDGEIQPIFSLISTLEDDGGKVGVKIGGSSSFYGQIIAPYSQVLINGSGQFYGEVSAGSITVDGAGGFHYDEAFGDMPDGLNEGGAIALPRLQAIGDL
ncbi:DUF7305 domain-containing protein [Billgrantia sp. LNSP4103-1]|uniref:DUF7305 domain-containing protein n=1 Tax=Billgrantia sp. LNSP4103-1 TaxID=3410266 RepID=UPI00403F1482